MKHLKKFSVLIMTIAVLTAGSLMVSTIVGAESVPESLSILLTNDDGWDAPGITKMKEALETAGHTVTVAAPDTNQSGMSMALNLGLPFFIPVDHGDNVYSLIASNFSGSSEMSATPAMCVLWGIYILDQEPLDLIISGINDGINVGTGTVLSGTVGAAILGMEMGTPSIAISTDLPYDSDTSIIDEQAANEAQFSNAAEFMLRFIEQLQNKKGSLRNEPNLLPDGISLNVNYPTIVPEEIAGVKICVSGKVWENIVSFTPSPYHPEGMFLLSGKPNPNPGTDARKSDVTAIDEGFITVVPVQGDYTMPLMTLGMKWWFRGLNP